jgi:hypothetical protein
MVGVHRRTSIALAVARYERGAGKLLEAHTAIRTPEGTQVLFETYQRFGAVSASASRILRTLAPPLLGGLLVLLAVQVPLAYGLARRLQRDHDERERLLARAIDLVFVGCSADQCQTRSTSRRSTAASAPTSPSITPSPARAGSSSSSTRATSPGAGTAARVRSGWTTTPAPTASRSVRPTRKVVFALRKRPFPRATSCI